MRPLPSRDPGYEPPYPHLDKLAPAARACLRDCATLPLIRLEKGYARPGGKLHRLLVVESLINLGLVKRFAIMGTAGMRKQLYLTGEGAWAVRTLRRIPQ